MKLLFSLLVFFMFSITKAQSIFANSFGDTTKPVVLFLHDGPGSNAVSFEASTAKKLAKEGFRVICYDQRGCGRSKKDSLIKNFGFKKAIDDILGLYKRFGFQKAVLLAHGWGGSLATAFVRANPEKVSKLILVNAELSYPLSCKTIINNSLVAAQLKNDTASIRQLKLLAKSDSSKWKYAEQCFAFADKFKLYEPKQRSAASKTLLEEISKHKHAQQIGKINEHPRNGFYHNERYSLLDNEYFLKLAKTGGIALFGIYGNEDRSFDEKQLNQIKNLCGIENYFEMKGSAHNPFLDDNEAFLKVVMDILNLP